MPLDLNSMQSKDRKSALTTLIKFHETAMAKDITSVLKGQSCEDLRHLTFLHDPEIESMTLLEQGTDSGNKIITTTEVAKPVISSIKDRRNFVTHLEAPQTGLKLIPFQLFRD